MSLPSWLQTMLDNAKAENDAYGFVLPQTRLALYAQLDPMNSTPPNRKVIRGTLAIRAAAEVMPYWMEILPLFEDEPDDDEIPAKMLDMAREVVAGNANLPDTWAYANAHWHITSNVVDEIFEFREDIPNPIAFAAEAAHKALLEAMGVETLKPRPHHTLDGDRQSSEYTDDAAAAASIVVSGGGGTDVPVLEKVRHEFWDWWLTTAVPETWQQVGED